MTIEVREATPGEFAEVGRVTADAYREFVRDGDDDWRAYLTHIADVEGRADRTTILVAVEEGQILGSATLELFDRVEPEDDPTLHPDEAHVRMVGVDPVARRRGIARGLFDRCFELARENRKTFVTLHTTERMRTAQQMYEAMGFRRLDDRVFPDGFVLLTYRIEL
ncbi:MAG: GNAT family N-acetyltransferase [Actinomycetota bacterium]